MMEAGRCKQAFPHILAAILQGSKSSQSDDSESDSDLNSKQPKAPPANQLRPGRETILMILASLHTQAS
jgi:hypothetical protein